MHAKGPTTIREVHREAARDHVSMYGTRLMPAVEPSPLALRPGAAVDLATEDGFTGGFFGPGFTAERAGDRWAPGPREHFRPRDDMMRYGEAGPQLAEAAPRFLLGANGRPRPLLNLDGAVSLRSSSTLTASQGFAAFPFVTPGPATVEVSASVVDPVVVSAAVPTPPAAASPGVGRRADVSASTPLPASTAPVVVAKPALPKLDKKQACSPRPPCVIACMCLRVCACVCARVCVLCPSLLAVPCPDGATGG